MSSISIRNPFGPDLLVAFNDQGFAVLEDALDAREVDELLAAVAELPAEEKLRGGVRGVLRKSLVLREFAEHGPPVVAARSILGTTAQAVKGTLFDKSPRHNWKVPWHQDLTIAVAWRIDVVGFGPWSVKDGVARIQPPADVLAGLIAVRVHLDATGPKQGALRVIPGSHRYGKLGEAAIEDAKRSTGEVVCPVGRGGLMFMAPLLLHASSASEQDGHRRVIHIEYAAKPLPRGLEWAEI